MYSDRKETNINKNTHRLTFSKKETPSLLSKHIHKWDQDRGEEEEEEEQDRFISPETVPELLASNEPWIRNTYLKHKPIFFYLLPILSTVLKPGKSGQRRATCRTRQPIWYYQATLASSSTAEFKIDIANPRLISQLCNMHPTSGDA